MTRRARIVLSSATALLLLFAIAIGAIVGVIQTPFGHERIRQVVLSALRSQVHGSVYVGHITGGLLNGVTVDSFAIRDPDDSLFVSTGAVTLQYDLRDLLDRRILIHAGHVEHPWVHIFQHANGDWNFRRVFPPSKTPSVSRGGGLGSFIVIDSTVIRDAAFSLTLPWRPSDHLHGRVRDSVIRAQVAMPDRDIRRSREGYVRTWRWTKGNGLLVHGRLANPDSAGSEFHVAGLAGTEFDPAFQFRNVGGSVRVLGDSVWLDAPHFDLPGSTGKAKGKIVWGSDLPVRYAIHVIADSMSLRDVAWVYPTLPRTGGGRTELDIRNNPRDLHLLDYVLTKMDARSTRSRITGAMTFELGADTLVVKDVQLGLSPVNFDLLRTLNGKPFPYDWQGDITGTVRASGGNLGRFKVEDANLSFADANVPGAMARGQGSGELNIFIPALMEFHEFKVNAETVDLRTFQYVNKEFPQLQGTISGMATLDSSWLDVRFHDATLFHHDEENPVSRVTGSGRVTWGAEYLTYDLTMQADSIAMTTMSRSYPGVPLRGMFAGPIRVQGQSPALHVSTTLAGHGGTLGYDGIVDLDPPVYGTRGNGTVENGDASLLLDNTKLPHTNLNGTFAVDLIGDSLATLSGAATTHMASSTVNGTTIEPSEATVHFRDGVLYVDTALVRAHGVQLDAHGTVAMVGTQHGSLLYSLAFDSVAAVNRLLGSATPLPIHGGGTLRGTIAGTLDTLALEGALTAHNIAYKSTSVENASGTVALENVIHAPHGTLSLIADTINTGLISLPQATVRLDVADLQHATFSAQVHGHGNVHVGAHGAIVTTDTSTLVTVQGGGVSLDSINKYSLSSLTHVLMTPHALTMDSLVLARIRGGAIGLRDVRMAGDTIQGSLRTSDLDLGVLELLGLPVTKLAGGLTVDLSMMGTTQHPEFNGAVKITDGNMFFPQSGTQLNHINANIVLDTDTLRIERLTSNTGSSPRGTIAIEGTVALSHYDNPVFALRAEIANFPALDKRGLASLTVSTSSPLTLTGPYSAAVVHGGILVNRGTIYIPELISKRVVDLNDPELYDVIDTTEAQNRSLLPETPSEFTKNLRLEDVAINIGDDVWLRSAEANIKLGGSLNVTLGGIAQTGDTHTNDRQRLALQGELRATRGTYRLNIVPLVQPTFEVENGTLRFFGTPDLDPTLDITAINTVRTSQQGMTRQDIRIRATIGGTLSQPTLTLSSADNLPLTQSDLLSYLITGEPAFALDYTTRTYVNQLAAVAIRSAGSVISSAIPRSVFDVVELQTPSAQDAADAQERIDNPTLYNLLNTRAVLGKQLNNNLFLNFSTGFCAENFRNNLGFQLEYRFSRIYRLLFGLEPGSSDLACARSTVVQSVQETPPQFGLDFFRTWRF